MANTPQDAFGWMHDNLLFISAILVSISTFLLSRIQGEREPLRLLEVFNDAKRGGMVV